MKKDLHLEYYPEAKVKCACGATFTIGATRPELKIEMCSHCHPFYTGQEKIVDTAGRVEKFKSRTTKKTSDLKAKHVKKAVKKAQKSSPKSKTAK